LEKQNKHTLASVSLPHSSSVHGQTSAS